MSTPTNASPRRGEAAAAPHSARPKGGALPSAFAPAEHEPRILARWESARAFHADPERVLSGEKPPFCVLIPPPNVTGALHLGHALNNTLQDILVRAARMRGFEALWMPGADHAGIATQTVVEQRVLAPMGKKRSELAREEFVALVQEWKDDYEQRIQRQLQAMGCSCDFARWRFTMDDICARAVREAFFRLFKAGLIYRGKRLVNWDPVTQTALSDDEVEMREVEGAFYYLRYPLILSPLPAGEGGERSEPGEGSAPVLWSDLASRGYPGAEKREPGEQAFLTVATTRPETYLGDTAVAVNPKDARAMALRGLSVRLPFVGRAIPIIEDDYVVIAADDPGAPGVDAKARFATGFLKVTPAHDQNDWEIGQRHKLPAINVLAPDATISDTHGWTDTGEAKQWVGLDRFEARERIVEAFKAAGLLEAVKPMRHTVGHSYRSHAPIEPYLSDQWYVKVTDPRLVGSAQRALVPEQRQWLPRGLGGGAVAPGDNAMRFVPPRYAKMYESWHEGLRDWCISRQLWWGHRIPVWTMIPNTAVFLQSPDARDGAEEQGLIKLQEALRSYTNQCGIADQICCRRGDAPAGHTFPLYVCAASSQAYESLQLINAYVAAHADENQGVEVQTANRIRQQFGRDAQQAASRIVLRILQCEQDPDVLDTWFSSALWPLSTMGWPEPDAHEQTRHLLDAFNPTSVLSTAREIITLWVSRMVMANRFFLGANQDDPQRFIPGERPFDEVYIHAVVQDGAGQRMSKSLGNGVDPLDIIESHGADALRFALCELATQTQDVRLPVDVVCPHCGAIFEPTTITTPAGHAVHAPTQTCPKCKGAMVTAYGAGAGLARESATTPLAKNTSARFDIGRRVANKLWNAARLALSLLEAGAEERADATVEAPSSESDRLALVDRWMRDRLFHAVSDITRAIDERRFSDYAQLLYDLLWRDFCDWRLEAVKPTARSNPAQQALLRAELDCILRLAHPACPFVTEAIWERLRATAPANERSIAGLRLPDAPLLCQAAWPTVSDSLRDEAATAEFERLRELVSAIREARAQAGVAPKARLSLHLPEALLEPLRAHARLIETLAGLSSVTNQAASAAGAIALTFEATELRLTGDDASGSADERKAALAKRAVDLDASIRRLESRLANPGYVDKAPAHLVEQTRQELADLIRERDAARAALERQE